VKLRNEFTVPAGVEQAFAVLLDVERVAPCLPGAALDGGDGETFSGTMKIKLGPVTSQYQGTVRIQEADATAHRAVLRAQARDARGQGTAAATITTVMDQAGSGTRVAVETDLQVSGPAAQFGRGVMQEVSGKLMGQFAECLAEQIGAAGALTGPAVDDVQSDGTPGRGEVGIEAAVLEYQDTAVGRLPRGPAADAALRAAAATGSGPRPQRRSAEVLDLGAASRGAVLKRLVPAVVLALAAIIVAVLWRRSRP
jgi:uncharacterized protein